MCHPHVALCSLTLWQWPRFPLVISDSVSPRKWDASMVIIFFPASYTTSSHALLHLNLVLWKVGPITGGKLRLWFWISQEIKIELPEENTNTVKSVTKYSPTGEQVCAHRPSQLWSPWCCLSIFLTLARVKLIPSSLYTLFSRFYVGWRR